MKRNMNKKSILLTVMGLAALVSCSKDGILTEEFRNSTGYNAAVQFGIAASDNATRASRKAGDTFVKDDEIAVYGFQNNTDLLFNNQKVVKTDSAVWTYSPLKYWQNWSDYRFYAMYPYSQEHSFNTTLPAVAPYFTITGFTVNNDQSLQTDVMIAKQNTTAPFNTVDFVFNHLLCNVNFCFKASAVYDFTGIDSISVINFDVTGLSSTANYTQTAWNPGTGMAVGSWGSHSGSYDFPEVTCGKVTDNTSDACTLAQDLLLMPQTIADSARLQLTYRIYYTDGSRATYTRGVRMADIKGTQSSTGTTSCISVWEPNCIYNYTVAINPSKSNVVFGAADYDGATGGYGNINCAVLMDENGDFWVDIDNDGAGDYPIVWEDIDSDGQHEGGVDLDGDGHIDNVILVCGENSDPGHPDTELVFELLPDDPTISNLIEFSATVLDWVI